MLFILLLTLPLLISCPIADPFAELEGINLLSTEEIAFTGWAVGYSKTVAYDYLTFSTSTETGPASGDTVRRIELVNLVPNGDFEAAISSEWSSDTGTPPNTTSNHLNYNLGKNDRVNYNMTDASNGLLDGLVSEASYIIHFDIRSSITGTSYFEYRLPRHAWNVDIKSTTATYKFPAEFHDIVDSSFTKSDSTSIFSIGTIDGGPTMAGYIDNLRITRTDVDSCLSITIPVTSTGRADLLSGMYKFTVYVKNDPDVTPTTPNRMPAEYLTMCIASPDGATISNLTAQSFSEDWSEWTACSVTGQIQIDNDAESALRLRVSPTDMYSASYKRTLGSLLISSPVLEFSSDGVFE